jgi:hypothetical protein
MTIKERLKNLLLEFSKTDNVEVETILNFVTAKLKDGTEVKVDGDLEVGKSVIIVETDTPAPDAEHELEDGTIVVTVEGVITEIRPAQEETPVEEEVEAQEEVIVDAEPAYQVSEEDIAGLLNVIETLQMEVGQSKTELDLLKGEVEALKSQLAEILNTPATPSVEENFNKLIQQNKNVEASKIRAERFKALKNLTEKN